MKLKFLSSLAFVLDAKQFIKMYQRFAKLNEEHFGEFDTNCVDKFGHEDDEDNDHNDKDDILEKVERRI